VYVQKQIKGFKIFNLKVIFVTVLGFAFFALQANLEIRIICLLCCVSVVKCFNL